MTYLLAALALVALAGVGFATGRRRSTAGTAVTAVLLLAAVVGIVVTSGPAQQVIAGGLVGLVAGNLAGGFSRRRASPLVPGAAAR